MKELLIIGGLVLVVVFGCEKEEFVNPYDQIENPNSDSTEVVLLDLNTLPGLHQQVFRPTCANSGCHDGTFEPDFRTIESTYNTLVNHPIIKNDPQETYNYRVVPGDVANSLLVARLTFDIDGNSGLMPLATEPDSDWLTKKESYIDNIKAWIMAGAPNAQ